MIRELVNCRMCGHRAFSEVVDFERRPVQTFYKEKPHILEKAPLTVVRCEHCFLVQLAHSMLLDRGPSFQESTIHREVVQDELVRKVCAAVAFEAEDRVLDIDCGDGTLLERYPHHVLTVGCDTDKMKLSDGMSNRRMDLAFPGGFRRDGILTNVGKFKAITALNSLPKVEDPTTFITDCAAVMADDGVLILQQPYWKSMVEDTVLDQFDFDYKTYWSLTVLERLLAQANLEMVGVEPASSSSVRVYVMKVGRDGLSGMPVDRQVELHARVQAMKLAEKMMGLEGRGIYQEFRRTMIRKVSALRLYLNKQKKLGGKIYAYGAAVRDIGLLQSLGIPEDFLTGVVDVHGEEKQGWLVAGSWAPIMTVVEKATHLLILPYYWAREIELREQQWLAMGGTMVYPLPVPSILHEGMATELAVPTGGLVRTNETVIGG